MGPDEPPLGGERDVEQGAGGEEGGEAGHEAPGVVWPLHLHPGHCVTVTDTLSHTHEDCQRYARYLILSHITSSYYQFDVISINS